jgi:PhnB protein
METHPYLFFNGRCDEAIEFYKAALGAKLEMLLRYKDCPEPPTAGPFPPQMLDRVMHAALRIGDSTVNLSDGQCTGDPVFSGFNLSVTVCSDADADRFITSLADGGKISMPPGRTFFSTRFGMVTDRFGMGWIVLVQG